MRGPGHRARRAQDFRQGEITGWPHAGDEALVTQVHYQADGKHKSYASPCWGQVGRAEGPRCPVFPGEAWPNIREALQAAMRAGVVQYDEARGPFPTRAWAFINGKLYEAKQSNKTSGMFHGFPLEYRAHFPRDPEGRLANAPRIEIAQQERR